MCNVWCGVCNVWCGVCNVVWCVQCVVWCVQCVVWCVQCVVWCVQCVVWCGCHVFVSMVTLQLYVVTSRQLQVCTYLRAPLFLCSSGSGSTPSLVADVTKYINMSVKCANDKDDAFGSTLTATFPSYLKLTVSYYCVGASILHGVFFFLLFFLLTSSPLHRSS